MGKVHGGWLFHDIDLAGLTDYAQENSNNSDELEKT